ncbi:MAG TPA: hypothetical protein VGM88_02160 [Kofleriaceae bacterium]|jgi:hypothetical protein
MRFVTLVVPLLALSLAACGDDGNKNNHDATTDVGVDTTPVDTGPDAAHLPVFRNPVSTADGQLATQALAILGEPDGTVCGGCHGLSRSHLTYWRALSDTTMSNCLVDLSVSNQQSALDMINCLRVDPTDSTSPFSTEKLGIYATAAYLPWFQYTFYRAYGAQWQQYLAQFQQQAGMPRGLTPLTQDQFDIIAEWYTRGLPYLNNSTPPDGDPSECLSYTTQDVLDHTTLLSTTGWRAINAGPPALNMYGCAGAASALDCLADRPLASSTSYGASWDAAGSHIRILADLNGFQSSYWSRSSPDGRWIGQGRNDTSHVTNNWGASMLDLQTRTGDAPTSIAVDDSYDPGFFPDNTGWVFQPGQNVCSLAALTTPTAATNGVNFADPGSHCTSINGIGLYQHLGRAVGGGDYFAIDSLFQSDSGGHSATFGDTDAGFGSGAQASFSPMMLSNGNYTAKPTVSVNMPYEGDVVLSPSASLTISRFEDQAGTHGYVLRKVIATPAGSTYTIQAPEIGRYCIAGEKPAFSYDERWIVFHHYVSPTSDADAQDLGFSSAADPGYAPYRTQGTANLYLMSLDTGAKMRITNMSPGQYALFPHFRSDGWIYADVRIAGQQHEYYMANDAALVAEQPVHHVARVQKHAKH